MFWKNRIVIGNDRCAIDNKCSLVSHLESKRYIVVDCGTNMEKPVDYPIYGEKVGKKVASGECAFGIALCGTGIGISIETNKIKSYSVRRGILLMKLPVL